MERFDPSTALQAPALACPDWATDRAMKQEGIFGERAIGELVRMIVVRLSQDAACTAGGD